MPLLQTPVFVEEFILDRTLDPAIEEFGLGGFRMIDPACGSGHFLLGSFRRLLDRWSKAEPGTNARKLVQRALDSVHGVDVNPYAAAIARFRLLLAALRACSITRLADAPAFRFNLACGDSLLHGSSGGDQLVLGFHELAHVYQSEDLLDLRRVLQAGYYHAVVANPPYITPKDKALNEAYRVRYTACHRQYSLAVPFMQRIFDLATAGGYTGQITANSFMKREFGKKVIEEFLPTVDLTHVIDTSLAHLLDYGTPTIILFGRARRPVAEVVRAVLGIKREDGEPADPAKGLVWAAILAQTDQPRSHSEFVSVSDVSRVLFAKHPWSIGGGGAAELKQRLDEDTTHVLSDLVQEIGFGAITREDEAYLVGAGTALNVVFPQDSCGIVEGDQVRDWSFSEPIGAIWPYNTSTLAVQIGASKRLFVALAATTDRTGCVWPNTTRTRSNVV